MADAQSMAGARVLIELLADRWTIPVLGALCANAGRQRFNALRRALPDISQKSLTVCLQRLEMNGLVERIVMTTRPLAVEYRVTALGHTLDQPVEALIAWSSRHMDQVLAARLHFEGQTHAPQALSG